MSQELDRALAIQLDDGRVVMATPKPEDQESLAKLDKEIVFLTATSDYDTAGHGYGDLIELDVEGHAITLRLPSPSDAEALRRALAVGAVTATIVAAGAIAALQGTQAPAVPQPAAPPAITDSRPIMNPHAAPEFGDRVAPRAPAVNDTLLMNPHAAPEFGDRVAPAAPVVQANPVPANQSLPDFRDRKDAAAEDMTSGGSLSDLPVVDEPTSQRGGGR